MIEYPAGKSLNPVVVTVVFTLDELSAVIFSLLTYYQVHASIVPDAAFALIQRLSDVYGIAVHQHAEDVLFEMKKSESPKGFQEKNF